MRHANSNSYSTRQFAVRDLDQVIMVNKKCLPENYPGTFFIDLYEVTNARYRECVTAGVCAMPNISARPRLSSNAPS